MVFVKTYVNFTTYVNYYNSVCELLILELIGDFNFPGVDWCSPNLSSLKPLVNLCDSLFLSQQVHRPTRKSIILE